MESKIMENLPDFTKLKVHDLKKELKVRGLNTSGHKAELLERLQSALNKNVIASADTVEDLDEDLLDGDDDEHLDENDSVLIFEANLEAEHLKTSKRKLSEEAPEISKQQKKIILNRNLLSKEINDTKENIMEIKDVKDPAPEDKKVIKLSEVTAKERLEMRAKKFGVSMVVDTKKIASNSDSDLSKIGASVEKSSTTVDVLKLRAERFGVCVSTKLSKLNNAEKLEKRKERFGKSSLNGSSTVQNDKAQQRLQRFKKPIVME